MYMYNKVVLRWKIKCGPKLYAMSTCRQWARCVQASLPIEWHDALILKTVSFFIQPKSALHQVPVVVLKKEWGVVHWIPTVYHMMGGLAKKIATPPYYLKFSWVDSSQIINLMTLEKILRCPKQKCNQNAEPLTWFGKQMCLLLRRRYSSLCNTWIFCSWSCRTNKKYCCRASNLLQHWYIVIC